MLRDTRDKQEPGAGWKRPPCAGDSVAGAAACGGGRQHAEQDQS